jgi:hypothetical protein
VFHGGLFGGIAHNFFCIFHLRELSNNHMAFIFLMPFACGRRTAVNSTGAGECIPDTKV